MTYSQDLRERVVAFVEAGGSKSEAARRFNVSRWCVYDWMSLKEPTELREHVEAFPDDYLHKRALHFNVSPPCVFYASRRLGITHKKDVTL